MPYGPACCSYKFLRVVCLAGLLGAPCVASAHAQPAPAIVASASPATEPSSSETPTAAAKPPVKAEIVPLDFAIRTKNGKPVLDLQPSDLVLSDNGLAVEMKTFRLVKGTDGPNRLVTLVFDGLDVAPAQSARRLAEKILAQFPPTGYSFAVLQISGSIAHQRAPLPAVSDPQPSSSPSPALRLLQNYTTSRDLLRSAIAQATSDAAHQFDGKPTPAEEQLNALARQDLSVAGANEDDRTERDRELLLTAMDEFRLDAQDGNSNASLSALLSLVRSQRTIAGRKIIVYFSQGLPRGDDSLRQATLVVAEANRSEVSVVTVDTSQHSAAANRAILAAIGAAPESDVYQPIFQQIRPFDSPDNPYAAFASITSWNSGTVEHKSPTVRSPLAELAIATGGVSFESSTNLKGSLRQLNDELTDYYEATYVPTLTSYTGAFHPLAVHSRRQHLVVRTLIGYFALPPEGDSRMRPYEAPLLAALANPQLPTEIAYYAQVLHLGELAGKNTSELVAAVPIAKLQVKTDQSTNLSSTRVAVLMQVRNAKGDVVERFSEEVLRHGRADAAHFRDAQLSSDRDATRLDHDAIVMEQPFAADPGNYILETAVLDEFGNKAGALRTKFTVSPPQPHLSLSDLSLVRRIDPVTPQTQSAAVVDPMRYKDGRIIPDLTGVLPEDTDHVSFFVLAHLAGEAQPKLTLRILHEGQQVSEIPLTPKLPITHESGGPVSQRQVFPWLGTVQANAFQPGHYEVQAILSQKGQTATATKSFVIEGKGTAADVSFTAVSGEADPDQDLPAERRLTESAALASSGFSISSPANPIAAPSPAELQALVESARQRALSWTASLPNFLCVETTWHSVYSRSRASWQPKDTAVQLMRYVDHAEDRTLVELNGHHSGLPPEVDFAHSTGEFGGALRTIFDPEAHTQFTWKETDLLDGQPVQVLAYRVERAGSEFAVTDQLHNAFVALHGLVWIDAATHTIRRLTETAEDVPQDEEIRAVSVSIDYAWITVDRHEYMLPVHGAVSVLRGRHDAELNQFEFRDYHRFGSQIRILHTSPTTAKLNQ